MQGYEDLIGCLIVFIGGYLMGYNIKKRVTSTPKTKDVE